MKAFRPFIFFETSKYEEEIEDVYFPTYAELKRKLKATMKKHGMDKATVYRYHRNSEFFEKYELVGGEPKMVKKDYM